VRRSTKSSKSESERARGNSEVVCEPGQDGDSSGDPGVVREPEPSWKGGGASSGSPKAGARRGELGKPEVARKPEREQGGGGSGDPEVVRGPERSW
jgi:hypothetical protein